MIAVDKNDRFFEGVRRDLMLAPMDEGNSAGLQRKGAQHALMGDAAERDNESQPFQAAKRRE